MATLVTSYSTEKIYDGVKLEDGPGTGSYPLPSRFMRKSSKKVVSNGRTSRGEANMALSKSLSALSTALSASSNGAATSVLRPAPSFPDRGHLGYMPMISSTGTIVLKVINPPVPAFRGTGQDTVGPGDYDPNHNLRFKSSTRTGFTKGQRDLPGRLSMIESQSKPGPGAYDLDPKYQRSQSPTGSSPGRVANDGINGTDDAFGDTFNLTEVDALVPPHLRTTSPTGSAAVAYSFQFQPELMKNGSRSRSASPSAAVGYSSASSSGKLVTGVAGLKSRGQQFQHLIESDAKRTSSSSRPSSGVMRDYELRQRSVNPPIQGTYKVRKLKGRKYPTHFALFGVNVRNNSNNNIPVSQQQPLEQQQHEPSLSSTTAQESIVRKEFDDSMMTTEQLKAVTTSLAQHPSAPRFKAPTDVEWHIVVPDNYSARPSNITVSTSGSAKQSRQSRRQKDKYPSPDSPTISDFDRANAELTRRQSLTRGRRSEHISRISFTSTQPKFAQFDPPPYATKSEAPEGFHYYPRIGMGDVAPKQNPKAGAFGRKDERFRELHDNFDPPADPFSLATAQLRAEFADIAPPGGKRDLQVRGNSSSSDQQQQVADTGASELRLFDSGHLTDQFVQRPLLRSPTSSLSAKPQPWSGFAPSNKQRLDPPVQPSPRPAPNAYDTYPRWLDKGTAVLAPPVGRIDKKLDTTPGPGTYRVATKLLDGKQNLKQVMLSTCGRDPFKHEFRAPGPGKYDPTPFLGAFVKKTHNKLLVDD